MNDSQGTSFDVVLKRTSKKLGIPEYKVYDVIYAMFGYVHSIVTSKKGADGFYFRFLGRLIIKPYRIKRVYDKYGHFKGEEVKFK